MNANFFGRTSLSMVMLCFLLPHLSTAPRRRRFEDDECEDKDSILIQSGTRCRSRNHGGDDGVSGYCPAAATPRHWRISRAASLRTPADRASAPPSRRAAPACKRRRALRNAPGPLHSEFRVQRRLMSSLREPRHSGATLWLNTSEFEHDWALRIEAHQAVEPAAGLREGHPASRVGLGEDHGVSVHGQSA